MLSSCSHSALTVHPRVCGEHDILPRDRVVPAGPSPRVRGTHAVEHGRVEPGRSIPACAGNTVDLDIPAGSLSVHPRVCGEHSSRSTSARPVVGPSPRVRGTLRDELVGLVPCRSIPACAGNTRRPPAPPCPPPVHPRVCGEHGDPAQLIPVLIGPSPRVRGTRRKPRRGYPARRSIPACAGNTVPVAMTANNSSVHPRVCGEHPAAVVQAWINNGPSPRVRGTRAST